MIPKVSIIVPVYNAGRFFHKCLESLIHQTLTEIEIILVLDCPTDGSDRIASEYSLKDDRIKIIYNKQNLNIGLSRNEGLKIAQGEYIGFSDHDDWRESDMYEKLYRKAIEDCSDIVISNYDSRFPDRIIPHSSPLQVPIDTTEKQNILSHYIGDWTRNKEWEPLTRNGSMWHMIYKKELLENHHIQFLDNNKATFEDLFFLIQTFHFANKVSYIPRTFYHHMYHQANQINNYHYYSTPCIINYIENLNRFLESEEIKDKYLLNFFSTTLYFLWRSLKNEIKHKSFPATLSQFKRIRKNATIHNSVRQVPLNIHMMKKLKIQKTILWLLLRC